MVRVAGTDPGTSSLDVLILENGTVADQARFLPDDLRAEVGAPVRWLEERSPFDLVAGPSGYGLPLQRAHACTERDLALMTLVRPDEVGQSQGVTKFSSLLRAFVSSSLPVVFLPGVLHLSTLARHRKINQVDLGTPDKVCVAALALAQRARQNATACGKATFCLVELGSAFTACLAVAEGAIVDGAGGTSGPWGYRSGGCWDGEVAYLLSPLRKSDLFSGGLQDCLDPQAGDLRFCESIFKAVAGLQAVTPFREIVLAGRLLEENNGRIRNLWENWLPRLGKVHSLANLPGAWVKHAAQGAALLADGLAGGIYQPIVQSLSLETAGGTVLDWLWHPRGDEVRQMFLDPGS
jgi:predicted butyrate kinase (DUF1464 family)